MKVLGLIVEYNPFHNGHIYHINKAKELINPDITIVVMSGNFVQRGEPAIIDKWSRASVAINHGIDLVVELPFVYATQSADYFARGAIKLLNALQVTDIVFGSEQGDINQFIEIAGAIKNNQHQYDQLINEYMQQGIRYPDACNKALSTLLNKSVTTPNDLLGLSYVKEVINNNYDINMHCIKRTNDFHSIELQAISSATSLRHAFKNNIDVSNSLPNIELYNNELFYLNDYFKLLKYKILTTSLTELKNIHLVEEGQENLLKQMIVTINTMDEFINCISSKRYTRSRIQRMIIYILMNVSKTEIKDALDIDYLRILKMNDTGQSYLNKIKKDCIFKIVTNFSSYRHPALDLEFKATMLYSCLSKHPNRIIESEYKNIPVIK